MKQLLPKLKKIDCKKLISIKKSQIDRVIDGLYRMVVLTDIQRRPICDFYLKIKKVNFQFD